VLFPRNTVGLNLEEKTLPELLKAEGYATALIGKWHLGYPRPSASRSRT
jgi:arylsulfatase A-like enzyme